MSLDNQSITHLPEHDFGESTSEGVSVHAGVDEGLLRALLRVARQVGEDLRSHDRVSRHEVRVGDFVRQSQHADANT